MAEKRLRPFDSDFPEGSAFLSILWEKQAQCTEATERRIPTVDEKARSCYECIGTVLSLLDRAGSCYWYCPEDSHTLQYLLCHAENLGFAALTLLRGGLYQESIGLARQAGEVANLLVLFAVVPGELMTWAQADEHERQSSYRPVLVRQRLEANGVFIPVDRERYGALSGLGVHPEPSPPQAFSHPKIGGVGGRLQEVGMLLALNEMGYALCWVGFAMAYLIDISNGERREVIHASAELLRNVGDIGVVRPGLDEREAASLNNLLRKAWSTVYG